jgi:hypothetical protein
VHTAEVLGRESWSLPIIGVAFVVVGRMGVDVAYFSHEYLVFISDVLLFLLTIAATLFAYFRVLRIIFSPSRLRDSSIGLAREKTRGVLLRSVRVRIGNNLLFQRLDRNGVGFWPLGSSRERDYIILNALRSGYLVDVHLDEIETFVERLPWRIPAAQTGTHVSSPIAPESRRDDSVWLLRRYGDRLTEGNLGLIRLRRASFADLTGDGRRALEARLRSFVRISGSDEF